MIPWSWAVAGMLGCLLGGLFVGLRFKIRDIDHRVYPSQVWEGY